MNQDQLTDLQPSDHNANTDAANAPTPVPTTILEDIRVQKAKVMTKSGWKHAIVEEQKVYLTDEALTEIETYYATRLKKCIGEYTEYTPPESIQDHWSLTESAIIRQMENIKNLGRQELRAEILSKWEQA